jgi:uncharacterized protein (TIGR04442 family)
MIRDLSFHGSQGPVDFYAYVCGPEAKNTYIYEEGEGFVRFFSRGNEFAITADSIRYSGAGGSFCEYMFGVEQSLKDLVKKEVLNRLVMFGAFLDRSERLVFTNETTGSVPFDKLFLYGHAVKNYYFFISSDSKEEDRKRQRRIVGSVGKFLKHTALVGEDRDPELVQKFLQSVKEPGATVFIFRLVHRANREFYNVFNLIYSRDRVVARDDELYLSELAARLKIDYYQQERMKIDCLYRHAENRPIVDQYRDILIGSLGRSALDNSEVARLRRLKTLRVRNRMPGALFETLDNMLLKGKKIQDIQEPDYLKESRSIFENLFLAPSLKHHIINEDIVKLVRAKHSAYARGEMGFEQMLLDIGKLCDEAAKDTGDYSILEELSGILTYFDRYDHVQSSLSQLAFMRDTNLGEDFIRSLVGNKKEFDDLEEGLFDSIFIKDMLSNRYITNYGKKKLKVFSSGLGRISTGDASLRDVVAGLRMVADEERLYWQIHSALKEKLRSFYPSIDSSEGREEIRRDIEKELQEKGVSLKVPGKLFEKALLDLKKESFYINNVLPHVIKSTDTALREDFLANSGLDRFYIEGLEKEYFEDKGLDAFLLDLLKEGAQQAS